jgi:hypothetical protein
VGGYVSILCGEVKNWLQGLTDWHALDFCVRVLDARVVDREHLVERLA